MSASSAHTNMTKNISYNEYYISMMNNHNDNVNQSYQDFSFIH